MKKILSLTLAVLMIALAVVPAFASAGGTVTFIGPSAAYAGEEGLGDAYCFVKADPENDLQGMLFEADPDGAYVCYDGWYVTPEELYSYELDHLKDKTTYSPVTYETDTAITPEDDVLVFYVLTSRKYNPATVTVMVNDVAKAPNADGSYVVTVDQDLEIRVLEKSATGNDALQRNYYNVKMISGEGYNVRPLKNEGYHYTFYGDSFAFRVQIKNNYSAGSLKVCVVRDVDLKHDEMGEFDSVGNLLGKNEDAIPTGTDEDGYRTYRVDNVTSDCKIIVTGVKETKKVDILSILKRIIRMILKFFGVEIEELDNFVGERTVSIDNRLADRGVLLEVLSADTQADTNASSFAVAAGSTVSFMVTRPEDQEVNVTWTGLDAGGYNVAWKYTRDKDTGKMVYTGVFNLDNVKEDVTITVS